VPRQRLQPARSRLLCVAAHGREEKKAADFRTAFLATSMQGLRLLGATLRLLRPDAGLHTAAAACAGFSAVQSTAPRELTSLQRRGMQPVPELAPELTHAAASARVRRALSLALASGPLAGRFLEGSAFSVLEVRSCGHPTARPS